MGGRIEVVFRPSCGEPLMFVINCGNRSDGHLFNQVIENPIHIFPMIGGKQESKGKWWYPWDGTLNNQPHVHLI